MDKAVSEAILRRVREKQATDPLIAALNANAANDVNSQVLGQVGKSLLWGAGIGTATRGTLGLLDLLGRANTKPAVTSDLQTIELPAEEKRKKQASVLSKAPEALLNWTKGVATGSSAETPAAHPLYYGGMGAAGLVGGALGWKALDAVLRERQKRETQQQFDDAKQEFQSALSQRLGVGQKAASAQGLGLTLDQLFDVFEKRAFGEQAAGLAANTYGAYALPIALLAGYKAYQVGKRGRQSEVLRRALETRARERQDSQPPELYATLKEPQ